ncbi:MAG TPA: hypothetical protein VN607_08555 [Gemmatimonadaceae bacterium]|nr:hypothetical protein [Gemmatimonadaceae bacterium]
MTLNLLEVGTPAEREDVVLPNGRRFLLRLLDGPGYALQKESERTDIDPAARVELWRRLMRYILEPLPNQPEASDEDLNTLITDDGTLIAAVLGAATRRLNIVMAALKNGRRLAASRASGSQPSTPKTPPPTPLPASPARTGATGSTSGAGRSTKRSPRSTSSPKPSASTPS